MDLENIYGCLCDRTRLRIVNLLLRGPLCVCHFQEVLHEPQVKISKHLAYLKRNGLVESERCGTWMIYRLPRKPAAALRTTLDSLRVCLDEDRRYMADAARLPKLRDGLAQDCPDCVKGPAADCSGKERAKSSRKP